MTGAAWIHRYCAWQSCTTLSTTQVLHLFSVRGCTTHRNGWLTWFSQSLVLTQPSVYVVILIASARCEETLCPALPHYATSHHVPHRSRLLCYQIEDARQKCKPKDEQCVLLQHCLHVCVCARVQVFACQNCQKCWQQSKSRNTVAQLSNFSI